ncbi:hypothetical protein CCHR01_03392 [Colletotrichum chrysophilum]|uniref:Zn(2)-C6 fungal-type domain-containing protein n=1 Tax=Colletotrichum chrysophilum TaxID=1836956 RepID=A0AAD9AV68_9PEZI|nr:hypothetical protein CCHR01_03392 [Colletotrichum chrysophilum]
MMSDGSRADLGDASAPQESPRYRRTYVACDSCRARKVRCNMGEKPPCAKCKREHRDCRFDRRPRTAKHRDVPAWAGSTTSQRLTTSPAQQSLSDVTQAVSSAALTQANARAHQQEVSPEDTIPSTDPDNHPIAWPQSSLPDSRSISDRVMSSLVTGSNDALDVLSDAANLLHHNTASPASGPPTQPTLAMQDIPVAVPAAISPGCQSGAGFNIITLSEPTDAILDMWDKCRFVRQGWFTSQEAVTYVDLFYKYLSPWSPVVVDQYWNHEAHTALICEESMLCCTILMISSRFFMLPGAGGVSRSHLIHNRLWQYCESLIKRIILGQEKVSSAKMRIIGTIESLLLISDWHPRAVHFPPDTEGWDAVLVDTEYDRQNRKRTNNEEPLLRWRKDVFEPAKRASRMSWMLLGLATNLAYELGVLSSDHQGDASGLNIAEQSISIVVARSSMRHIDDEAQVSWNTHMDAYLELTRLSKVASTMFFQSKNHLESVLQNDNYPDLLEHFLASLSTWNNTFGSTLTDTHEPLKDSLLIELYHLKACIGSISIQAVVKRATVSGSVRPHQDGLASYMTVQDAKFLRGVLSDSCQVLEMVTERPFREHLAYAPAPTDVDGALRALDRCTTTLKNYPPDDMDFAMRYADLIERHASSLRGTLSSMSQPLREGRRPSQALTDGHMSSLYSGLDLTTSHSETATTEAALLDQSGFWRTWQFDSSIAPFGDTADQLSHGFDVDSLNFLWNLPDISS